MNLRCNLFNFITLREFVTTAVLNSPAFRPGILPHRLRQMERDTRHELLRIRSLLVFNSPNYKRNN
jgi:hypothetical protein